MRHIFKTHLVDNYLQQNNLSAEEFCKKCDISLVNFANIMQSGKVCSSVLGRVARVLNVHITDLFISVP
ncbi:MAG: hypothetical protein ACI4TT_03860 [Christensenellales bacterium]